MTGKLGIILFVLTLSLSVLVNAENVTKICSERSPIYKEAGDKFYKTFAAMVASRINNEAENMTALTKDSVAFFDAAKTCNINFTDIAKTRNLTIYIELIEFALKNASLLKDLQTNGQFKCIMEQKVALTNCVNGSKSYNHTKYAALMIKSRLYFNNVSCSRTSKNKECILKVLNKECKSSVGFVKGLFDIVTANHCKNTTVTTNHHLKSGADKTAAFWATFVVFMVEWAKLIEM